MVRRELLQKVEATLDKQLSCDVAIFCRNERSRQCRGGFVEDYLPWVRTLPAMRTSAGTPGNTGMDYMAKVPYRSIGR
jgi:hypothetical protein